MGRQNDSKSFILFAYGDEDIFDEHLSAWLAVGVVEKHC